MALLLINDRNDFEFSIERHECQIAQQGILIETKQTELALMSLLHSPLKFDILIGRAFSNRVT